MKDAGKTMFPPRPPFFGLVHRSPPPGLPAEAVKCIGDRLAAAKVPPFDVGEEMVTRGHWFVP